MSFCTYCGTELEENARFCASCGKNVSSEGGNGNTSTLEQRPVSQGSNDSGKTFLVLGWVFAGISVLFIPILFGAGGVIFGYLYRKTDQTHGTIIIIASIALAILGTLLGAAVDNTYYY